MKVAVLSDVHGFSPALRNVLEDIRRMDVDQIMAAGDHCAQGPDPAGSIHLLREYNCSAVFGNTDRDVLDKSGSDNEALAWTKGQLGEAELAWLEHLPFSIRIPHPGGRAQNPSSDLLVVHANPVDVDRHLSPNASDRELLRIIEGEPARTIAFGHLHIAFTRQVENHTLVDVSAVGSPRDRDLRPRYVVFDSEFSETGWTHEYHYLDYPLEETRALMEASGMPDWQNGWARLNEAAYRRQL